MSQMQKVEDRASNFLSVREHLVLYLQNTLQSTSVAENSYKVQIHTLCSFPAAAVTNYHNLTNLFLQFWRSETHNESHRAKVKVLAEWRFSWRLEGRSSASPFPAPGGCPHSSEARLQHLFPFLSLTRTLMITGNPPGYSRILSLITSAQSPLSHERAYSQVWGIKAET